MEWLSKLQRVDELRVKARRHLNTHAAEEEPNVHQPQVGLLVPWRLVLRHEAGEDGVGGIAHVDHFGGGYRRTL